MNFYKIILVKIYDYFILPFCFDWQQKNEIRGYFPEYIESKTYFKLYVFEIIIQTEMEFLHKRQITTLCLVTLISFVMINVNDVWHNWLFWTPTQYLCQKGHLSEHSTTVCRRSIDSTHIRWNELYSVPNYNYAINIDVGEKLQNTPTCLSKHTGWLRTSASNV